MRPADGGLRTEASTIGEHGEHNVLSALAVSDDGEPSLGQSLLAMGSIDGDRQLTVPGDAMSLAQREALMRLPAFSDDGDPLFGAAVWKYRDANAGGLARAAKQGRVDPFGRTVQPVFAEIDGAPADAEGRPMADATRELGARLDMAANAHGAPMAVAVMQRALNGLGDEQVRAETPRDGRQARRKIPRLLVDGILGPKSQQATRLALHQLGAGPVSTRLQQELGRVALPAEPQATRSAG